MYAYISGKITEKQPTYVVVETGGIGYLIHISLNTYNSIQEKESAKLLTHLHVKEDAQTLFGFFEDRERKLFVLLISVSGVGPNTARILLSSLLPNELESAILEESVDTFKKVKGIGPKTAKRIILDLKDKILKDSPQTGLSGGIKDNTLKAEALSALIALGFNKIRVQKLLHIIISNNPEITTVETLIKEALRQLS